MVSEEPPPLPPPEEEAPSAGGAGGGSPEALMEKHAHLEKIPVTEDGKVVKQITREGEGDERPVKSCTCFAHYRCWVMDVDEDRKEDFDRVIHDTWAAKEPKQLSAGRDSSLWEKGLTLALLSMRKGEVALLHCGHEYGYGEEGHFSFPLVPGSAPLMYEVELLDWEQPDDSRERATMTYEERCEAAERRKNRGNELFKEGKLDEALAQYDMGLSYINEDFMIQLMGFHHKHAMGIRTPCMLNSAAAQIRQEKYEEAIATCTEVLQQDRKSAKAYFRRGKARRLLGQGNAARADLEQAAKLEPGNREVQAEVRLLKKEEGELRKAEKKAFAGVFGAAPPPVPSQAVPQGVLQRVVAFLWALLARVGLGRALGTHA